MQNRENSIRDSYVLKNVQEFFAVTASLYLWGNLARKRDLYRHLAAATVELKSYAAPKPSEP